MTDREEKMLNQLAGIGIALDVAGYHADAQCVRDALALLLEQKPVPVVVQGEDEWRGDYVSCPDCGTEWMADADRTHYCPNCGRRVVWEVNADGRR